MLGQMMQGRLLISALLDHAGTYHAKTEITSVETDGSVTRSNWGEVQRNAKNLASALTKMGLKPSARCATIAWNNRRHLEIYFGVSGGQFVCHTINPRLFPEQLVYIVNHAEDEVLFIDATFLPLATALRDKMPTLKAIVLMGTRNESALEQIPELQFYDELIETGDDDYAWPDFDENTASSLCYTSGTTGNPKGVLYSHRSTMLHSFASALPDCIGFSARDIILPVVPMFHVNAWGTPYAAAMVGAQLVMPGPGLDGSSLLKLIDREKVNVALGVPTIWQGLLMAAKDAGSTLDSLKRTVVGGSACPPVMIDTFRDVYNVDLVHAWGMTEMSPLGTSNQPLAKHGALPLEAQRKLRENQGRPPFGMQLKIVDEDGNDLPHDGAAQGDLLVRGPWVLTGYFRPEKPEALRDGWFDTGDVARIDPDGYMTICDRSKDIIKSGGEWISSVELENIAAAHPDLLEAAVIGAAHPKWDERPVLVAVKAEGRDPDPADLIAFFEGKIASWQKPDAVVFTNSLPRNATGKVLKRNLREEFGQVLM
ncbi:long-chain-fatty-acid--CoA ligase [Planktotalea arctica]|uniref:long-chain-fatty-acid--CoA ligase n=1 Tax=Planktotalea arctica TaxID=1481893 RepID=UPI000A1744EA|nr:long-chain-fatty-acid--CoA ligase [Planktotalea arctica]